MWRRLISKFNWRRQAPLIVTVSVACLLVIDVTRSVHAVRAISRVEPLPPPATVAAPDAGVDVGQITQAHLFGQPKVALVAVDPGGAPETQLALLLSGIIATADPKAGFAILGAADKPAHLYETGAALEAVTGGRLYAVFADRVVLDLDGKLETLRLPHHDLPPAAGVPRAPGEGATEVAQNAAPAGIETDPDVITPAQGWFANLNVERTLVGDSAGLVLHPGKGFQRKYGLKDSDVLTAVNGVEVTDSDTLAGILRTTARSLSLTYVRDGVPRTVNLPMLN